MQTKMLGLRDIEVRSMGELTELFRQGYRISSDPGSIRSSDGNTIIKMSDGTTITVIGIGLAIVSIMIASLIYYKLGKWEAKKLGWD